MDDDTATIGDEKGPERSCIVTRDKDEPGRLIRFVIGPEGTVVPDIRAKLPGRGAWVSGTADVLGAALKRKAFQRAFKRDVGVDPRLVEQVDQLLERDALQALAFANKAGQVVCGAMKVETALDRNSLVGLIHAVDGSADGIRKIENAVRRSLKEDRDDMLRVQFFSSSQLDLALGRSNVIHAGLLAGGVSAGFLARSARLQRFRGATPAKPTDMLHVAAFDEI